MEHYFTNNTNLKSELRTIIYKIDDKEFTFFSDNGVFSKDRVDFGSSLLVKTIIENKKDKFLNILDVGCGYGFIGIILSKLMSSKVTMIDINDRAIHLTLKNIKELDIDGEAYVSDGYSNVDGKYDLIVSNPPIRAGKNVVYRILDEAFNYLTDNGELWFVIRKEQGAKSAIKHLEEKHFVKVVEKSKGFYIIMAKKP